MSDVEGKVVGSDERVSMELKVQRHRTVRAGLAIGHEAERVNGAVGTRAT